MPAHPFNPRFSTVLFTAAGRLAQPRGADPGLPLPLRPGAQLLASRKPGHPLRLPWRARGWPAGCSAVTHVAAFVSPRRYTPPKQALWVWAAQHVSGLARMYGARAWLGLRRRSIAARLHLCEATHALLSFFVPVPLVRCCQGAACPRRSRGAAGRGAGGCGRRCCPWRRTREGEELGSGGSPTHRCCWVLPAAGRSVHADPERRLWHLRRYICHFALFGPLRGYLRPAAHQ